MFLCKREAVERKHTAGFLSSALVLPWIHEDAGVELSVYIGGVGVLSLEIGLIHSLSEHPCFMEYIITVKVLIGRLREVILIQSRRVLAHLVLDHSIVEVICGATICPELIANPVLWFPRTDRNTALLEIIVFIRSVAVAENLRLSAEILLRILREIINGSLVFVERAQVLIIIRILVVIK